ncbi:acyltransferase [Chitinophaga oryzae]|uniref:Acyltransferase n=1 Tax=Chitinophaga oryzae TaxID=2725414 RepID=A0AAE7DAA5_9BACT|nr:acyltransferase [Chitinophaga oryzae]QJB34099.1 acyltransferase [Chitinophaga oryzae]QJB40618.1 acyltransferase [Chitinophaga oryzae]
MHQNNFDFLRFLFAFVVVLGHIVALSAVDSLEFLRPYFDTHLCVTGFFVVSGFLITQSYIRSRDLKKYLIKRANRLLPAYIFVVCITALGLSVISTVPVKEYFTGVGLYKYLVCNLLFMNFLQPCLPGVFLHNILCAVNGALWTIKLEVSFYLLLPVIIYIVDRVKKKYLVFLGIYLLSLFYRDAFEFLYHATGKNLYSILSHQLPGYMTYFIAGVALHYWFNAFLRYKKHMIAVALIVFLIEYYFKIEYLLPIAWSVIVMYFAYSFTGLNGFGRYGDVSYGIYIFHYPIIQIFVAFGAFHRYNPYKISFIIILIVLLVAILSWHLLEKRFLKRTTAKIGLDGLIQPKQAVNGRPTR